MHSFICQFDSHFYLQHPVIISHQFFCHTIYMPPDSLSHSTPGAPLTYFNDEGEGSEWFFLVWNFGQKWFFGGSMKDAGIFWVAKKKQRDFLELRIKD